MRRTRVRTRRPKRKMVKHQKRTRRNMSKHQKRRTGKRCKTCQRGG